MNVTNVVIVVAFLAVLGAWLLSRPQGTGSQAAPAAVEPAAGRSEQASVSSVSEDVLSSLKRELTALKRENDRLTQSMRETQAALDRLVSSDVQSSAPSAVEREEAAAQAANDQGPSEEEQIAAMLSELDLRLGTEADDPAWGHGAEMDIATLLHADAMQGSRVLSVDCHSTLCRMEVEHQDASVQSHLVDRLPMEPPFDGEMMFHRIDDGGASAPRTLIYLARSGQPLLPAIP